MNNEQILQIAKQAGYSHEDELVHAFKGFNLFYFAKLLEQFLYRGIAQDHSCSHHTDDPEDLL